MRFMLGCVAGVLLAGIALGAERPEDKPVVLERAELDGGLVREKIRLPGCDPSDPVPAIAVYPKEAARLPLVFLFHWFRGSKETMEPWARELAAKGFFAVAPDLPWHGERSVKGVFARPDMPNLGEEFAVFIHQSSIAHGARDFPFLLDALRGRKEIDPERLGVGGFSMGAGLVMVLAWQEKRIRAAVSLAGACDFWWDVTKVPPGPKQDEVKAAYSERVRRLVASIDPWPRADRFAPTPLLMANGRKDGYIDIESVRRFVEKLKTHYAATPDRFRFIEEDAGHEETARMHREANDWLTRFLAPPPAPAAGAPSAEAVTGRHPASGGGRRGSS
ncbi:MAG TPA: dienelactone hydrolase family protein [Phycisphaerae bacterium]|nr:dienelactone hydrolase family protein [Phycisphaerae bacterium]